MSGAGAGRTGRSLAARCAALGLALALAGPATAEPRRATRPRALSGGISVIGAGGGEAIPFLTAAAVQDLGPQLSAVADLSFFTSGDRLFGPRALLKVGARAYLRDAAASPYLGAVLVAYHEWDVDYPYSDRSQGASTALGAGGLVGHELVTRGGMTWAVEATAFHLIEVEVYAPEGLSWQVTTVVGYRY